MSKLLAGASVAALLSITPVLAQSTQPSPSAPSSAGSSATSTPAVTPPATGGSTATPGTSTTPGHSATAPEAASTTATSPGSSAAATPGTSPSSSAAAATGLTMSQAQAERWVGKTLYSSDGKNLGDIASIERTGDKVTEVRADIGGFLGFGETRIRLMPNQVKFSGDSATTTLSQAEAKALPGIDK